VGESSRIKPSFAAIGWPTILFALAALWYVAARTTLGRGIERSDDRAMTVASKLLADRLDQAKRRAAGKCALLANDPRLKAALTTASFDESAFSELLGEIREIGGSDTLLILSPEAKVLAAAPARSWRGLDLRSATAIKQALASAVVATDVWGHERSILAISASAIRLGDQLIAIIVLGEPLDAQILPSIEALTGTSGALFVNEELALTADPDLGPAFAQLRTMAPGPTGTIDHRGVRMLARSEHVADSALPAHVVWLRPSQLDRGDFRAVFVLLWLPLLAAFGFGGLVVWRARAENRT
jgi:hypothetical protein